VSRARAIPRASFLLLIILAAAAGAAAPSPTGAAAKGTGEWDAFVHETSKEIAAAHGLPLKAPVAWMALPQEKLLARIEQLVFVDYTRQEVLDEGRLQVRLGLFPAGTSYEGTVFALLEEQVLGLFDPRERELLVAGELAGGIELSTIRHEITHAIQDQHLGLQELLARVPMGGDRQAARSALLEGDALLLEEVMAGGAGLPDGLDADGIEALMSMAGPEGSKVAKAPPAIRKALFFPYSYGYVFARKVFAKGGYAAVNDALKKPPDSTEQVIHPDRYFAGDAPAQVSLAVPGALLDRYRVAVQDVAGELGLRVWLQEHVDRLAANLAAEGWEGDRYVFLWPRDKTLGPVNLGRGVFIQAARMESGAANGDAAELEAALEELARVRWQPALVEEKGGMRLYRSFLGEWIAIRRDGDVVLYVEGLPADAFPKPLPLLDALASSIVVVQ